MFNFHLLAIAQHYAWKSSLGNLARKILAVTFPAQKQCRTKIDKKQNIYSLILDD
jgi:hypothetical protein